MQKEIIVIGGGPAGIEAALAAAGQGARVSIVSNAPLGGRAGWHSLLPSKVWLTAADSKAAAALSAVRGLSASEVKADPAALLQRLQEVKEAWNGRLAAAVAAAGVTVITGSAQFANAQEIVITDKAGAERQMRADAYIVTSGSVPIFPPGMKPDGNRVIAPRFASALNSLPASMVVIGGGVTGTEFVYLFNQLGVQVTWVVDQYGVLPDFDAEAGAFMVELFQKRGVQIVAGQPAAGIERDEDGVQVQVGDRVVAAEMAFVAIGRKPDVANLGLQTVGLPLEEGTTAVNRYGRTAQPHIYLAGDVTGNPMVANRALAQAWVAGNHAAGAEVAPFRPSTVVAAVYTTPQVAAVGRMTARTTRVEYNAAMKSHLLGHTEGFIKLAVDEDGRVAGAVAVGDHAADLLAPVAVAIQARMSAAEFAAVYPAHPTMGELAFMAARQCA